jgi:threonyl-tRNA synthetase
LPISERFNDYAKEIVQKLREKDIRGSVDERNEKIGRKIRDAEVGKTPYMLLVGEKEVESNMVSVRKKGEGDLGTMSLEDFMTHFVKAVDAELAE